MVDGFPLVAVVAMARNRVIGDGKKLLWHLPDDLKRVKALTMGRPLIMGRATFESIGKPLGGRGNIILTRRKDYAPNGTLIAHDKTAALRLANEWIASESLDAKEIIIFGGGQIYAEFMPMLSRIELTEVDCAPDGDAVFPEINFAAWDVSGIESHLPQGDAPGYTYKTLTLKR